MSVGSGRGGIYSIGAVARMLGVPVATLRNWEERYAAVAPERSPGGQRLYSPDQVERLRYVAEQVARGLSPADAHRLLAQREPAGGVAPEAGTERSRPLVLLAERDRVAAAITQAVLRAEGYAVETVFTVADARQRWLDSGAQVAIVELMIAGGQGLDLCRQLRQRGGGSVLAVSGLAARDEALAAGADAFLHKPVDPLALVAAVAELLASHAPVAA
jgi:DNA-binding transcriptional MerR regulator